MIRRVRMVVIAGAVLAGLILVAVLIVRSLLNPQRFTGILQQAVSAVGLVMELRGKAEAELFPRPAINLHGLRLHLPAEPLLLSAEQLDLVIPWSSLLGGAPAITRLELTAPQVDLAQVQHWLELMPPSELDRPPALPDIGVGVVIRDGRLVSADQLLLDGVAINAGALHMGQRFLLHAEAELPQGEPLQLQISVTPRQGETGVRLNDLKLQIAIGDSSHLLLAGNMVWFGGNQLRGELTGEIDLANTSYTAGLMFTPAPATGLLMVDVQVEGDKTHIALQLSPRTLAAWWQHIRDPDRTRLTMPPLLGTATAQKFELGSLHIQGLRIESTFPAGRASVAPASASSAPGTVTATDNRR